MSIFNPLTWFRQKPASGAVWTIELADVTELGQSENLWRYRVVWRKGATAMEGTYSFPSRKPLEKVRALAQMEA